MPHIKQLLDIMTTLRDPQHGCSWDREQNFQSLACYTIEEAYEVVDAISRGNMAELREELGDLLFQVVFQAQMAQEQGFFDFYDVVRTLCEKLRRRHPHVFAGEEAGSRELQNERWQRIKQQERHQKGGQISASICDQVKQGKPALFKAWELQQRVSVHGFDWATMEGVLEKIGEELTEVRDAALVPDNLLAVQAEVGDLLFSCVNLSRFVHVHPEILLQQATLKFAGRIRGVEQLMAQLGKTWGDFSTVELEILWQQVKAAEDNPL